MGLAIAKEMQTLLEPATIILLGSRAAGDHRPESDADLMAICKDDTARKKTNEKLVQILQGRQDQPVTNVTTITEEEFHRTAPIAQLSLIHI